MFYPNIDGQLAWDSTKNEVQYIISWSDRGKQSEQVTGIHGKIGVVSEGRTNDVATITELVRAKSGAIIKHPNGKLVIEMPSEVTTDNDLYFALFSGYNIDPPSGKKLIAGGVGYNITAMPMTADESGRVEPESLDAQITLRFSYSDDLPVDSLEACYLNPRDENPQWQPVPKSSVVVKDGHVHVTTARLGAYALMMRLDATYNDAQSALVEAIEAFNLIAKHRGSNGSNGSLAEAARTLVN